MGCSAQLMIFFVEIDQNVLRTNFQYLEFLNTFLVFILKHYIGPCLLSQPIFQWESRFPPWSWAGKGFSVGGVGGS